LEGTQINQEEGHKEEEAKEARAEGEEPVEELDLLGVKVVQEGLLVGGL